jgi:hypothetical protein
MAAKESAELSQGRLKLLVVSLEQTRAQFFHFVLSRIHGPNLEHTMRANSNRLLR